MNFGDFEKEIKLNAGTVEKFDLSKLPKVTAKGQSQLKDELKQAINT